MARRFRASSSRPRSKVVLELENSRKRSYSKRAFIDEDIAYIEKYAR